MSNVQQNNNTHILTYLGSVLVAIAFVAVVVAYPPSITGILPLFGIGAFFLPLIVATVAQLLAIVGGVLLAHGISETRTEPVEVLPFHVLAPVAGVVVIGVYLVVIAGFGTLAPAIIGPVVLAALVGIVDEVVS